MLLAFVDIRLIENDVIAEAGQRPQHAAELGALHIPATQAKANATRAELQVDPLERQSLRRYRNRREAYQHPGLGVFQHEA